MLVALLCLLPFLTAAESLERSGNALIKRYISYANYGKADVFISLEQNGEKCSFGYFVNQDNAGYHTVVSTLLAAYHAKRPVSILADETVRWAGSIQPVCVIYLVEYSDG